MKRNVLKVVPVLVVLGLILAGCAVPTSPNGAPGVKAIGRDVIGLQPGDTVKVSTEYPTWTQVTVNGSTVWVYNFQLLDPVTGANIGNAWCADVGIESRVFGDTYKVVSVPGFFQGEKLTQLKAALTYIANNYQDWAANKPNFYQVLIQSIIWIIQNDASVTYVNGNDSIMSVDDRAVALQAIQDVMANLDQITADYNVAITMQGQGDVTGYGYGPFNVSENSLFPGIVYTLKMDQGSATFVDADGNPLAGNQVKAGEPFFVKVADGASGDFHFTATGSADAGYQVVTDLLLLYQISDADKLAADPSSPISCQPLFQPLFQPLTSLVTETKYYSCSGYFTIVPVTGSIVLQKTVDGINIATWAKGQDINALISFELWQNGGKVATSGVDANGMVSFGNLADGTYSVKEVLTAAGQKVFQQAADMTITITGHKQVSADGFDASVAFSSFIPYQGADNVTVRVNLADGLVYNSDWNGTMTGSFDNPYFEDFHVQAPDGSTYSSYCAAWYSDMLNTGLINYDRFAGAKGAAAKANIVQAFNYIYANWGSLDQWPVGPGANNEAIPQNATKLISQMVVYKLLDDGVTSTEVLGAQAWVNQYVDQVLANYSTYNGPSAVADVAFLAQINFVVGQQNHNQPQLVPIYAPAFNNTVKETPPPPPALGPSQSSVTATNAGNVPTILKGLNPKNGNPYYGDKNNPDTPFVVPNSNHFVYAQFTRDELLAGQALDFVVGNNYTIVGTGFVKLVGDKLEITINGKGSFGALAFNKLPAPKNGNIQSVTKAADAAAFGALAGFSFNSQALIPCPAGNTIWLYIDCDSFQFYK
ncbi:MAG: prealbumin-like fold domain-containing protein [Treponema sp.]|nr:prealbumin-like fold domain-containing protein [Treponema sp.]